jgi:hypothetical protein
MHGNFVEKVKGFLLKPAETFSATASESLNSAFQYYVILLIIYSILLAIVISVSLGITYYTLPLTGILGSNGASIMNAFTPFLVSYVLFIPYLVFMASLFGIFLSGLFYHVFVILFGGQKGVAQTVKTVMYAWTPFFLIGWIPFISIIGVIWSWILIIIGIRENQEMTYGVAALVLIVPLILSLIFFIGLFAVIVSFISAIASILPG